MSNSETDRVSPKPLRNLVELARANLAEMTQLGILLALMIATIAASRVPDATVLGSLMVVITLVIVSDHRSATIAKEAADREAAYEAAGSARIATILELIRAMMRRRLDICSRRNEVDTFRQMIGGMWAYRPRFPIEATILPDGSVIVNGAAIYAIVELRCRADVPFLWTIALPWACEGQLLFGETERERRRIAATLYAIRAIARERPGMTTEHISICRLAEQLDPTTVILTHSKEFDCDVLVSYHADSEGLRPGTNAPPREVLIDPRPEEVQLFRTRAEGLEATGEKHTLDDFLESAMPLLSKGVYFDRPGEAISNGDHMGNGLASRECIYMPVAEKPQAARDEAIELPPARPARAE